MTIKVDLSEATAIDESRVGRPITTVCHFEVRENPELGPHGVFEAHSAEAGAFSDAGGGTSDAPPSR